MINPRTFISKDSRWQDLFMFLKNKGYDVYSPEMKIGECLSEHLVILNAGSSKLPNYSTDEDIYTIMVNVPRNSYSRLEVLVNQVKKDMKELYPMFKDRGQQSPSFYDSTVKSHSIGIDFTNYKKR